MRAASLETALSNGSTTTSVFRPFPDVHPFGVKGRLEDAMHTVCKKGAQLLGRSVAAGDGGS